MNEKNYFVQGCFPVHLYYNFFQSNNFILIVVNYVKYISDTKNTLGGACLLS